MNSLICGCVGGARRRGTGIAPTRPLPCFTVWKNTAAVEDGYVTGLEPAINFPNFKSFERQQGRVKVLPAGGQWDSLVTAAGSPAGYRPFGG